MLDGRLYVKQKIIAPLIQAKKEPALRTIIKYLESNPTQLTSEIRDALIQSNQESFLLRVVNTALNNISPFLEILAKISEMLPK
jgi:hypothetical protein